ncbi:MAG: cupin domain-containing protein [Deltaproteobacteria bacterium]|nr:cupin domain-containing protein [Deltaproteobacteria bacterium]
MSGADHAAVEVVRAIADREHVPASHGRTGEPLGRVLSLVDCARYTVDHVQLTRGERSTPTHRHSHTEEVLLVLSGTLALESDGAVHTLAAGDFARLRPSDRVMHTLVATTEVTLIFVRILDPNDVTSFR